MWPWVWCSLNRSIPIGRWFAIWSAVLKPTCWFGALDIIPAYSISYWILLMNSLVKFLLLAKMIFYLKSISMLRINRNFFFIIIILWLL
jgi:hypothetical protein